MKLHFLGTGASDWTQEAKDAAGYHRHFSSAIVDGELLIDPGPHVLLACKEQGIDPASIRHIILTHPHNDHYSRETVEALGALGAEFHHMTAGESLTLGALTIRAVEGNHPTAAYCNHFHISKGKKRLFYALDGAWLTYDAFKTLKTYGADLAVLDATIGDCPGDYRIFEHNNLSMVEILKESLMPYVDRFMISHMAMTLHTDHDALVRRMEPSSIEVAYDGLTIEL